MNFYSLFHKFETKILAETEKIYAQRLFYKVFYEEMNRKLAPNNPTGRRILEEKGHKYTIDNYDNNAIYFGTYFKNQLIASYRCCNRLNGLYKLEHYRNIPERYKYKPSIEINSLVVDSKFRKSSALLDLYCMSYSFLSQKYRYLFGTCTFPNPGNLYINLGGIKIDSEPFIKDSLHFYLVEFDFENNERAESIIKSYRQKNNL